MNRGEAINRCAFLASQITTLRIQVLAWEKDARKTPPKTLLKQWEFVRQASKNAELGKQRLDTMYAELVQLSTVADWWAELLGKDPRKE